MLKKLSIGLALAFSGTAFAGIPMVTDDSGTQGTGGHQIELSFSRDKAEDASRAREVALVYTLGVTETIDLFVEQGFQKNTSDLGESTSGYGNTILGGKWLAWESEHKTSFALGASVALPVSENREAKELGTGKTSYDLVLILTQEMPWGSVDANLGAGREKFRDPAANTDTTHFSVAPAYNLNEQIKLALDLGIDRAKTDTTTEKSRYAEIAVVYAPSEDFELGLGYIRTTDQDTKAVTKNITGGVTWRFK